MTEQQTPAPAATGDSRPVEDAAIVPHDLQNLERVKVAGELDLLTAATAFAASGMFPDVKRQSQAVVKIVAGYELGIKPFAAMRGIHFITFKSKQTDANGREHWVEQGVLELSANLRGALIKRSDHYDYRVRHLDEESCVIEFFERAPGGGPFESVGVSEYTVAQAAKAGITADRGSKKSNWALYPEDMCFAAALRRGAKRFCPDLFVGELEIDDAQAVQAVAERELTEPSGVVDGEFVEERPDLAPAESDPGVAAQGASDATEPAGPTQDAAAPGELFGDGSPPVAEAPGEDVPDDEPVYVGLIPIHRVPEPHEPADDTEDRVSSARVKELRTLMPRLQLVPGALESVFAARYGFPVNDARKATAQDFEAWVEAQTKAAKA